MKHEWKSPLGEPEFIIETDNPRAFINAFMKTSYRESNPTTTATTLNGNVAIEVGMRAEDPKKTLDKLLKEFGGNYL